MHVPYPVVRPSFPREHRAVRLTLVGIVILTMLLVAHPFAGPGTYVATTPSLTPSTSIPLAFVPNVGQSDPIVRFQSHTLQGTLFFMPGEVALAVPASPNRSRAHAFTKPEMASVLTPQAVAPSMVHIHFDKASATTEVVGVAPLTGVANYFIGNDPARWRTSVPTYAGLVYKNLYPGIDLSYDGAQKRIKGTYTIAPGADPSLIQWHYTGFTAIALDAATGDLQLTIDQHHNQVMTEHAPIAWQNIDGRRVPVTVRYILHEDQHVGFALASYDTHQPLIIDPTLVWSTYLGGSGSDYSESMALDSANNVYLTGDIDSVNFPTANPAQATFGGSVMCL